MENWSHVFYLTDFELFEQAFPKNSPLVPDISRAIINITDGDDLIQIEKKWIGDQNCENKGSITESNGLNFLSFWGLFLITGVVSTISLLISIIISLCKKRQKMIKTASLETNSDETNDVESFPSINHEENQGGDYFRSLSPEGDANSSPEYNHQ
jgi:glutamate receptor, ionotropic, plant